MQESCFLWEEFLRRQKIIIDGHMSQLEKRAVRTLAITKDRNTIQISLSKKWECLSHITRDPKGQAAYVPRCIKDSNEVNRILFLHLLVLRASKWLHFQTNLSFIMPTWLLAVPCSKCAYSARRRERLSLF